MEAIKAIVSSIPRKCGLCDDFGEFEKIGAGYYCEMHAEALRLRMENAKKLTLSFLVDRDELVTLRSDRVVSIKTYIYLALMIDKELGKHRKQAPDAFCDRWAIQREDLFSAMAALSKVSLCYFNVESLSVKIPEGKEAKPQSIQSVAESVACEPLILDIKMLDGLKKEKLISPSSYIYLRLRIEGYGTNFKAFDIELYTKKFAMSTNDLLIQLASLSKKGLINIDADLFSSEVFSHEQKLKNLAAIYEKS